MSIFDLPQWINWKAVPKDNGKVDKIPLQGMKSPHLWMTYDQAKAKSPLVGFWLTEADPYYAIDIDDCLQADRSWSPLALEICGRYVGCYIEISPSGRGLRIFGRGPLPPHSCRNSKGIELYHTEHFLTVTGTGATGDSDFVVDTGVHKWLIDTYLPPKQASSDIPVDVVEQTRTDEDVVKRLLAAKPGVSTIFGDSATATQLWVGDDGALERAYPNAQGGHGYDASRADAALAQHLMWHTAGCSEQVERLIGVSGLARDKWADREDYRVRTLDRAWRLWKDGQPVTGGDTDTDPEAGEERLREGFQYLDPSMQRKYFKGCVYVRDLDRVLMPDGGLLNASRFRATMGGYTFALDSGSGKSAKTGRNAWEAFTENQGITHVWAHTSCFRPEMGLGAIKVVGGVRMVNTYVPIETEAKPGDPGRFLAHVEKMLPVAGDRDILLAYMASLVQNPGVKFQWTPLIQGVEGNGKSMLIRVLTHCVGARYTHLPNAADLGNTFNSWIYGNLFIGVEEIFTRDRMEITEPLKRMITDDRLEIHGKGVDQVTGDNRCNFLMCSNHQDAVRKSRNDRRFCVFFMAQQEYGDLHRDGVGGNYFPELYRWLRTEGYAIVNHFLKSYQIPELLDPAKECHRAPETSSTSEAIAVGLGIAEQEILEAIAEGRQGFRKGWLSSISVERLLKEKTGRNLSARKRGEIVHSLGYSPHPGLHGGRASVVVPLDGGRPRLYMSAGHPGFKLHPEEVTDVFVQDQS